MTRRSGWAVTGAATAFAVTICVVQGARAEPDDVRQLTLAECTQLALAHNPDVVSAADEIDAARAARSIARAKLAPRVRTEANAQRWNGPLDTSFALPGLPAVPFVIREGTTTAVTVSLVQPLGSLWSLLEDHRVRALGVDLAQTRHELERRQTAYRVAEAFYRLLAARRLDEVATRAVEQLETHRAHADAFERQGLVGANDRLRADLGVATARQRRIQTTGEVTLARSRLAVLLGLPPDVSIEPIGAPSELPAVDHPGLDAQEQRGLAQRLELREVDRRVEQARAAVRMATSRFVPDLTAVAGYQRNTGSTFVPAGASFVGAFLTWDAWDWGSTYYGRVEASARLRQALVARTKVEDAIRLEMRSAYVAEEAAVQALDVARRAVAEAEENFRIESRRYEAGANTSFDVLDAQALLTQSRAAVETSLYDYFIAQAALRLAIGDPPDAITGGV